MAARTTPAGAVAQRPNRAQQRANSRAFRAAQAEAALAAGQIVNDQPHIMTSTAKVLLETGKTVVVPNAVEWTATDEGHGTLVVRCADGSGEMFAPGTWRRVTILPGAPYLA